MFSRLMRSVSLVPVLGLAMIMAGCTGMFKGKKAGEQAIAEFHRLYNEGKVAGIYATSDAKFKKATTEKQFLELMGAIQKKLGKVTASTNAGFNVNTFNLTTRVVLNQKTTFEQGSGTEVFTFEMNGDKAVLVGYHVNSNELILN
jgi:hypothetical protein